MTLYYKVWYSKGMDKNKHQSVRIYNETLERIRRLAKLRNTTIPRMIDEMSIDYEIDLRSIEEVKSNLTKVGAKSDAEEERIRNDRIIDRM